MKREGFTNTYRDVKPQEIILTGKNEMRCEGFKDRLERPNFVANVELGCSKHITVPVNKFKISSDINSKSGSRMQKEEWHGATEIEWNERKGTKNLHLGNPRYCIHSLSRVVPSRNPPEKFILIQNRQKKYTQGVKCA